MTSRLIACSNPGGAVRCSSRAAAAARGCLTCALHLQIQHLPANEFATLIFLPSFCPNKMPTTRLFVPLAARAAWSTTLSSTSGCTTTVEDASAAMSSLVAAGMAVGSGCWMESGCVKAVEGSTSLNSKWLLQLRTKSSHATFTAGEDDCATSFRTTIERASTIPAHGHASYFHTNDNHMLRQCVIGEHPESLPVFESA